ncbi:hypothetical protein EZV61_19135 [Corallincola luteus]|uniref:DUF378 domain-containing protein n=1 Tax=Corallincola luteus TaxID=1775177 RepID=A0ABY2AIW6_9GAMM|nr:hypothetical protein [Corallincola luteus]TCI01152.1 hypothetical protein EZV61_19135 [Corallincola luteus]
MKIVGIILILIGLLDVIGSHVGFDLWGGFFGIELPDLLWQFSGYIELGAGYLLMKMGSSSDDAAAQTEAE